MRKTNPYYSESERYIGGFFQKTISNAIAGLIIAGIITVAYLLTGCEQPELRQTETNGIDSIQTEAKDSIENWDNDTTAYHTTAKPS